LPADRDAIVLATAGVAAAEAKQATDIVILDVSDILGLVDLFALATARNPRQLKAVGEEIERVAREEQSRRPLRREGTVDGGWVLLDYGDVVFHLFDETQRTYYSLERLWSDVDRIDPATGAFVHVDVPASLAADGPG